MEDRKQPFATFVLETLAHRSAEIAQRWARYARRAAATSGEPVAGGREATESSGDSAEQLVRSVLAAADGAHRHHQRLLEAGRAMGVHAHRRNASLHLMLEEVDLLGALMLRYAEDAAAEYAAGATGYDGLAVARQIVGVTSQLRRAATKGYTQAIEDELRERYRAIRHDLRNPLGTIRSAIALLTDKSVPAEMRESAQVRAMVVRNTSSLDQMIGEALGDDAARLRAFVTSGEGPADAAASAREQGDELARARQRSDLESGAL